jgi:hypothetical protein
MGDLTKEAGEQLHGVAVDEAGLGGVESLGQHLRSSLEHRRRQHQQALTGPQAQQLPAARLGW